MSGVPDPITVAPHAVTFDWLLGDAAEEAEDELRSAVIIALATDRRAEDDDALPSPGDTNRRGWWGDTNADVLFDAWPIGSRIWLLSRTKITGPEAKAGATVAHVQTYLNECLQPFVDAEIASAFTANPERTGVESIAADVVLYRGPLSAVALRFADLWSLIKS
ncbi:phage GP46 family protein [Methylobacterium sp. J-030]|uniref:phage GP46 family protein n=1 Tax=Methylobacterium sp. J-030 TaxID=2836627 RepID=UPI001FB95390|nr:phage GP46 family protein [Methylobacterium sp. J-030]MCJ2067745.1 phage GP46 family protein [Methylobacterium sp. J-030]